MAIHIQRVRTNKTSRRWGVILTRIDKKRLSAANTRGGGPGVQHTSQAGQNHRHDWRNTLQHSDNNTTTARATQQQADNDGEEDVTLHRCTANASTFFSKKHIYAAKSVKKIVKEQVARPTRSKTFIKSFLSQHLQAPKRCRQVAALVTKEAAKLRMLRNPDVVVHALKRKVSILFNK